MPPKRKAAPAEAPAAKKTKTTASKPKVLVPSPTEETAPKTKTTSSPQKIANTQAKATVKAATKTTDSAKPATKPRTGRPPKHKTKEDDETEEKLVTPLKKLRATATKKAAKKDVINQAPAQKLNVYVFGEGASGELGLGTAKSAINVKRPRLNPLLPADTVGVVQVSAGGMHVAALTHDNRILTWGVNDQGALGRNTRWDGGMKDVADDKSDSDTGSDSGLNPLEATPAEVPQDSFPERTVFVQVAAGDSTTFALTDEGDVWGWGTFRHNDGILGFSSRQPSFQSTPVRLPELKKIKQLVCGANHALALDHKGGVFAWGSGQQNQLGRRVVERTKMNGLVPREFGLPKGKTNNITYIECGAYHSFAIDQKGRVWAWGLNNFGETGIPQGSGESGASVSIPSVLEFFNDKEVNCITGGTHHSIAVTKAGKCYTWGRLDGCQLGIDIATLDKANVVYDERENPRIITEPAIVPIKGEAVFAAAGSDHCICITEQGKAWSWGFSANYQTGLGTDDDVAVATMIDNTAVREKKLNWAGCGGQYSIMTAPASESVALTNGI